MPLKCPLLSTFLPCPPSPWICGPSVILAPAWCLEARAAFDAGVVRLATANGNEEVTVGAQGAGRCLSARLYAEVHLLTARGSP